MQCYNLRSIVFPAFMSFPERRDVMCLQDGAVERDGLRVTAHTCISFVNDAISTTTNVMMFIIIYLIHHSNLQERMRKEIHGVVGETAHRVCQFMPTSY